MGIANHPLDARQTGQFLGRALRITTGDQNARRRIIAMHAADRAAHFIVGGLRDGARVHHDQVAAARSVAASNPLAASASSAAPSACEARQPKF